MTTLYDLLNPLLPPSSHGPPDTQTLNYLNRLHTLPLHDLSTTETALLSEESTHVLRSLQSLAKRSYRSIDAAASSLSSLSTTLPAINASSAALSSAIPALDAASTTFSTRYGTTASSLPAENDILVRRKKALQLAENLDRVEDILSLPSLLSSTIASASSGSDGSRAPLSSTGESRASTSTHATYTQALDLQSHIRRLTRLHPSSRLIAQISHQSETAMSDMINALIASLRGNNVKLASGLRTIGLLRRVAPEFTDGAPEARDEGSLGLLFLISRLAHLEGMITALEPLKELAEQESRSRVDMQGIKVDKGDRRGDWAAGQQTERYLKRFIEVFREVGFGVVSVYKGIFLPDETTGDRGAAAQDKEHDVRGSEEEKKKTDASEMEQRIPPALATFTLHLTSILFDTLRTFLPNVRDKSSRESLLTQVLYCAGSLGRLGADFGMMLALLEEDLAEEESLIAQQNSEEKHEEEEVPEWMAALKRHRIQAGRLELLASGAGAGAGGRKTEGAQPIAATS